MLGYRLVTCGHDALDLERAGSGVSDAGELGQEAIPGGIDDTAAVPRDQRTRERKVNATAFCGARSSASVCLTIPAMGTESAMAGASLKRHTLLMERMA